MRMTVEEARQIGESMLKIDRALFEKSLDKARKISTMQPKDLAPMALVLAILGQSGVNPADGKLPEEIGDAIDLIDKAEKAWRLMRRAN
jgi:hypothetical protein